MPDTPMNREEQFLAAIAGEAVDTPTPVTRKERFLQAILDSGVGGNVYTKIETDARIAEALTDIDLEHFHVVTELPATEDAVENHEYVLVTYDQDGQTIETEKHYLFYDGEYHARPTAVSLEGYATEDWVNERPSVARMVDFSLTNKTYTLPAIGSDTAPVNIDFVLPASVAEKYSVGGLLKYELKDSSGARVYGACLQQFSMNGKKELRTAWKAAGSTSKTVTTVSGSVLCLLR